MQTHALRLIKIYEFYPVSSGYNSDVILYLSSHFIRIKYEYNLIFYNSILLPYFINKSSCK